MAHHPLLRGWSVFTAVPASYYPAFSEGPPSVQCTMAALLLPHQHWTLLDSTSWLYYLSLVAQLVKNPPAVWETWAWSQGQENPLEKETATLSSILAWRIPWTEEPGGLYSPWGYRESDTMHHVTFLKNPHVAVGTCLDPCSVLKCHRWSVLSSSWYHSIFRPSGNHRVKGAIQLVPENWHVSWGLDSHDSSGVVVGTSSISPFQSGMLGSSGDTQTPFCTGSWMECSGGSLELPGRSCLKGECSSMFCTEGSGEVNYSCSSRTRVWIKR